MAISFIAGSNTVARSDEVHCAMFVSISFFVRLFVNDDALVLAIANAASTSAGVFEQFLKGSIFRCSVPEVTGFWPEFSFKYSIGSPQYQ